MEIKKFEVNKRQFTFVCETYENSNAWGHEVNLFEDDTKFISKARIRYYNRTWECYRYQTTMKKAVSYEIEYIKQQIENAYKNDNNVKRMTEKHRKALQDIYDNNKNLQDFIELYNIL